MPGPSKIVSPMPGPSNLSGIVSILYEIVLNGLGKEGLPCFVTKTTFTIDIINRPYQILKKKGNFSMNIFLSKVHGHKIEVLTSVFTPITHKSLLSFQFTANDIKSIMNKRYTNKVHGHDMSSIRMIKLWDEFIYKLLEMIFKSYLNLRDFSRRVEKANIVLVYKKGVISMSKTGFTSPGI